MKSITKTIYTTALAAFSIFALSFGISYAADSNGLQVLSSSESGIELLFTPNLSGFERIVSSDGTITFLPKIEGSDVKQGKPGEPSEVVVYASITVPSPDGFDLLDAGVEGVQTYQKLITPIPSAKNVNEIAEPDYVINKDKYTSSGLSDWVTLNYVGIGRNRHIAQLVITAARYNPATKSIEIPSKINIKIAFKKFLIPTSLRVKDDYDPVTTLNHSETTAWRQAAEPDRYAVGNIGKNANKLQSASDWVKIEIESEGIYKIDAQMLSALGVSISAAELNTVKIFGNGGKPLSEVVAEAQKNEMNEQAIIVKTKTGGELESIIFYAAAATGFEYRNNEFQKYNHWYSKNNYYLLTWGGEPGKRAQAAEPPSGAPEHQPTSYIHRTFFEEELNNAYSGGAGRIWFGRTFFTSPMITQLPNIDQTGTILYRFSLAHRSANDGTFKIKESGKLIKEQLLYGINLGNYENAYRQLSTVEKPVADYITDNRSVLMFEYKAIPETFTSALPFLDYFEIHYPRSFVPIDNEIAYFSDPTKSGICEYKINGFSGNEIIGFDATDLKNPQLISNSAVTGGMFIFNALNELNKPNRYFISSKLRTPKLEKTSIGNLRTSLAGTDVIVITHKDLLESAEEYARYRDSSSGLSVTTVTTEHIFNEFAGGVPDVTAIRDFVAFAFQNWQNKPKYVVLWGDGHLDFKHIQTNTTNFIPVYVSIDDETTFDEKETLCTDDFFGWVSGNDAIVDVAVGRLNIDKNEVGMWMIDKIRHYESGQSTDSWRTMVTLCADDGQTKNGSSDGSQYTDSSDIIAQNFVPDYLQVKTIYIVEYPTETVSSGRLKPRANQELLLAVNNVGTLILNWIGHGNPQVWAHENFLVRETTIPQMSNIDKLFFCVAATCDFARFDKMDTRSASEDMLLSKTGGAIGVISATRVVFSSDNSNFNKTIYSKLFTYDSATGNYPRLGDMWYAVKQVRYNFNDKQYVLLADPTLRLLLPNLDVVIDSVNGKHISEIGETIELKALSDVRLVCRVTKQNSVETDATFNGIASVNLYDGDQDVKMKDELGSVFAFSKLGGALNRSSYQVENGKFSTNFIIPKDISFSKKNGRLYIYATSDDNRFAKGKARNIIVNGIDDNATPDEKGPDIKLYLDDRSFVQGDMVRNSPSLIVDLFDESGINSTGLGIGHRIEAWIDDDPISIDLTDKYISSLTDSRYGTAQDFLPVLTPGVHKVKVRAWDVYNNFSITETYFRISGDGKVISMSSTYSYPNPFSDVINIVFRHNAAPPITAEIEICTPAGVHVRTLQQTLFTSLQSEVQWDGLDKDGVRVLNGAYMYRINLRASNGFAGSIGGGPMVYMK